MNETCRTCGVKNENPEYKNCETCRKYWREQQRKVDGNAAKVDRMQSKIATQRNEIAMLTRKLEAATKEKLQLLNDIKWMRGETPENRYFRQNSRTSASGSNAGEPSKLAEVKGGNPENWRK